MSDSIILENGKYEIKGVETGVGFKALRHGEDWRSLAGDGLVYTLAAEYLEKEKELKRSKAFIKLLELFFKKEQDEDLIYEVYSQFSDFDDLTEFLKNEGVLVDGFLPWIRVVVHREEVLLRAQPLMSFKIEQFDDREGDFIRVPELDKRSPLNNSYSHKAR